MKTLLILFLIALTYCSCTDAYNVKDNVQNMDSSNIAVYGCEKGTSDWPTSDSGVDRISFDIMYEYYYQILLNEWLKNVDRQQEKY